MTEEREKKEKRRLLPNKSHWFSTINQLFSTLQVPHFTGFTPFWVSRIKPFSLHFTTCYISSHLVKVEEKTMNSWTRNELFLFPHLCCQIRSNAGTGVFRSNSSYRLCKCMSIIKASWLPNTLCSTYTWNSWLWTECHLFAIAIYNTHLHEWPVAQSFYA